MTQQPGGWPQQGQPQQQAPQQQGGWAQPQQQAPQQQGGWAQPQQGQPQHQNAYPGQEQNMSGPTDDSAGLFGGGRGTPSFDFDRIGDVVEGKVLEVSKQQQRSYTTGELLVWDDGSARTQFKVVLQTDLRNWEKVSKIPTNDADQQLPPSEDDGTRAIYVKSKLQDALSKAMAEAGMVRGDSLVGRMLGVAFVGEQPSGKGNPFKLYAAKVGPLGGGPASPAAPPQQQAPQQGYQQAPQQQAPQGYQQPPQVTQPQHDQHAHQGYGQPPQQAAPQPQGQPQQQGGYEQAQQAPPQGDNAWGGYQPPAPSQGMPQPPAQNPWGGASQGGEPPF